METTSATEANSAAVSAKMTFINLPVLDLKATMNFFTGLGFTFNPMFTGETAAAMVINETTVAMLLIHDHFSQFTQKPIVDAHAQTELLIAMQLDSREAVDTMVEKAVSLGGKRYAEPADHGWMYQHSFEDLDGHQWEVMYADLSKLPGN